jgi:hypothetical protein
MKVFLLACWIVAGSAGAATVGCSTANPAHEAPPGGAHDGEPTQASCVASVAAARDLAERLPAGDASRYFAERDLQQAMTEAGNGEFDDCLEWAEQATVEVKEHRHTLQPGETLNVRPAEQ